MIKPRHTTLRNPHMRMAYRIAKDLYFVNRWNEKTVPVCVLVKDKKILSYGVGGNGMHQMTGMCARVDKPGSDYSLCQWCDGWQHAEQWALRRCQEDPRGATMYMYGMYKLCPVCEDTLEANGIKDVVILRRAKVLFDRHRIGTVVGKPKQFNK